MWDESTVMKRRAKERTDIKGKSSTYLKHSSNDPTLPPLPPSQLPSQSSLPPPPSSSSLVPFWLLKGEPSQVKTLKREISLQGDSRSSSRFNHGRRKRKQQLLFTFLLRLVPCILSHNEPLLSGGPLHSSTWALPFPSLAYFSLCPVFFEREERQIGRKKKGCSSTTMGTAFSRVIWMLCQIISPVSSFYGGGGPDSHLVPVWARAHTPVSLRATTGDDSDKQATLKSTAACNLLIPWFAISVSVKTVKGSGVIRPWRKQGLDNWDRLKRLPW